MTCTELFQQTFRNVSGRSDRMHAVGFQSIQRDWLAVCFLDL